MCHHNVSIRQPCSQCAASYYRLMADNSVDPWAAFVLSDPSVKVATS